VLVDIWCQTIWVGRLGSIPYRFAFFAYLKGADVKYLTDKGPRKDLPGTRIVDNQLETEQARVNT
jgi:hypothetical protein